MADVSRKQQYVQHSSLLFQPSSGGNGIQSNKQFSYSDLAIELDHLTTRLLSMQKNGYESLERVRQHLDQLAQLIEEAKLLFADLETSYAEDEAATETALRNAMDESMVVWNQCYLFLSHRPFLSLLRMLFLIVSL